MKSKKPTATFFTECKNNTIILKPQKDCKKNCGINHMVAGQGGNANE